MSPFARPLSPPCRPDKCLPQHDPAIAGPGSTIRTVQTADRCGAPSGSSAGFVRRPTFCCRPGKPRARTLHPPLLNPRWASDARIFTLRGRGCAAVRLRHGGALCESAKTLLHHNSGIGGLYRTVVGVVQDIRKASDLVFRRRKLFLQHQPDHAFGAWRRGQRAGVPIVVT